MRQLRVQDPDVLDTCSRRALALATFVGPRHNDLARFYPGTLS